MRTDFYASSVTSLSLAHSGSGLRVRSGVDTERAIFLPIGRRTWVRRLERGSLNVAPSKAVQKIQEPGIALPQSFAEAIQDGWGGEMVELPTDWRLVNKEQLIGVKFFVFEMVFQKEGKGEDGGYVSVHVVTEDDRRLVFNDGGTGVYQQAKDFVAQYKRSGGLLCEDGLRVSKYDHPKFGASETYYFT